MPLVPVPGGESAHFYTEQPQDQLDTPQLTVVEGLFVPEVIEPAELDELPSHDISGIELSRHQYLHLYYSSIGLTAEEAAGVREISGNTAKSHRRQTIAKMGAISMEGAVARGILTGKLQIEMLPEEERIEVPKSIEEAVVVIGAIDAKNLVRAKLLNKSEPTLKTQATTARRALGANKNIDLIRKGFEHGLLTPAVVLGLREEFGANLETGRID